jgi:hypothetical protein
VTREVDPTTLALHYERTPGKSACGRHLPTAGFFTDNLGEIEDRTGSRCKACWRSIVARGECEAETEITTELAEPAEPEPEEPPIPSCCLLARAPLKEST